MSARFHALDRLRALAVLSMVQGHTFSALLAEDALPRELMQIHGLVHGLTAPAFLYGAGLAFGVATYPQYERHREPGPALRARLRRYLMLALIGYALQLPGASLLGALSLRGAQLMPIFRVGPLHLIALCLAVCQLAALRASSARAHARFALLVGLGIMAVSPYVWSAQLGQRAGLPLGAWLDGSWGSLFPVFPWASFAFFGVASAGLFARSPGLAPGGGRALPWVGPGVLLSAGAYGLFSAGVRLAHDPWFWHSSPLYVLFRLGAVVALLGLLHGAARPHAEAEPGEGGLSALLARHSLVAYVSHLLLLYGTPWTPNLHRLFGQRLQAADACAAFVGILGATLLITYGWASIVKKGTLTQGWVRVALTAFGVFLLTR